MASKKLQIEYCEYNLDLKHTFTVSSFSRKSTPCILLRLTYDGIIGYGEASMPQYLGESIPDSLNFLQIIKQSKLTHPANLDDNLNYINSISKSCSSIKAALDIALHDIFGKLENKSWAKHQNYNLKHSLVSSYTIGIDSEEMIIKKIKEASEFEILKVKLGTPDDKKIISTIRKNTERPLYVDANQGWKDKEKTLELICWLKENNVLLVEQPFPVSMIKETEWLKQKSPLPIFADESIKRIEDIELVKNAFNGINVKLMKFGGIRQSEKIIKLAKESGMQIMLGCMTETSCGISAASQIIPLADYADLDGNLLIKKDPFEGSRIQDGKISVSDYPGVGIRNINNKYHLVFKKLFD